MSYQVKHSGTDISSYVITYRRTQRICAGVGVAEIVLGSHYPTAILPYNEFEIYEDGVKKGTFFTQTVAKSEPEHTITISAQDVSKLLVDYFIAEVYEITEPSTSKYWIEFLLQEAGVSYTFLPTGEGHDMSLNTSIGNESLIDRIQTLCVENGWYFLADENNNLVIGDLEVDFNNFSIAVTDASIREFNFNKNDKMLRNRVIVRGSASPYTKIWVYGEVKAITPWNYDTLDYRTTVITSPDMPNVVIASQLANQLFAETKKITEIKEVDLAGFHDAGCGDTIYINHSTFNGTGLITTVATEVSGRGEHTTYLVDERCPRMFGYYHGIGDVFISTFGSGVWRKPIRYSQVWSNYSTGLTNLNITDLSVANGILACVTDTGELYTNFPTESGWVKAIIPNAEDPEGVTYYSDEMEVNSVSVDPLTGIVRAGVNYTNPDLIPSGIRSWVAEVDYEKNIDMIPITYSGIIDLGTWDLETNDYATYIQTVENIVTLREDLIVDVTKEGSLNTIASVQGLGYTSSQFTTFPFHTQMYGQLSTTEFLDDSNITRQNLPGGATSNTALALYGSILYCAQGDRVYRLDLNAGTNKGKVIPDVGYLGIAQIAALDENHCSVYIGNVASHILYEVNVDFTNIASPTTTQTDISIADYWKNGVLAKYVVNYDFKHKLIITYQPDLPVGQYECTSWPYILYDCETHTYTTGGIAIPAFVGDDPSQYSYNATLTLVEGSRDIYSVPFLIQKVIWKQGPEDRNLISVMGFLSAETGVEITDTIYNEAVVNGTTLTTFSVVHPRYTSAGYVVGIYGFDLPSFNADPNTAWWGYTNKQFPGGGVIWDALWNNTTDQGPVLIYDNNQVVSSYSKENIFNHSTAIDYNVDDLNGAMIPPVDHTLPNPQTAKNWLYSIDDLYGKYLCVLKIGTDGSNSIFGIFLDDETTRILPSFTITEATSYDSYARGIFLLGGIIMYRAPSNGMWSAIYSKTLTETGVIGGGTGIQEILPFLEYKPNEPMKLLGYSASTYVNASQTRPIVLYGGDEEFNSGKFDMFDPVDLSFSNIFVSGYVTDTTTMRLLTDRGLSTCVLSCIHPSSGLLEDETTLWITDHDGVLTSGNDYGGLVIVDGGIIYTDPWHTYTMSGWYTFSGIVEHVETSNYDDQPYIFVSVRDNDTNVFYQMDAKRLEDAQNFFVNRSTGIPSASITRIRVDERI